MFTFQNMSLADFDSLRAQFPAGDGGSSGASTTSTQSSTQSTTTSSVTASSVASGGESPSVTSSVEAEGDASGAAGGRASGPDGTELLEDMISSGDAFDFSAFNLSDFGAFFSGVDPRTETSGTRSITVTSDASGENVLVDIVGSGSLSGSGSFGDSFFSDFF